MTTVLIVIHLMVVLAMIGLVLLQRSEGGALGIGGGSGAFMTGRGAANVLTRATAFLAVAFFATSLGLALLARIEARPSDILDFGSGAPAPADSQAPAAPVAGGGAPESAQDVLDALGGAGPQEAPAAPADGTAIPPTDDTPPPAEDAAPGPQEQPAPPTP